MPLKLMILKKVVPDFRHRENIYFDRENIYFDREILPPPRLKLRTFFTHNISKNGHMEYDMWIYWIK